MEKKHLNWYYGAWVLDSIYSLVLIFLGFWEQVNVYTMIAYAITIAMLLISAYILIKLRRTKEKLFLALPAFYVILSVLSSLVALAVGEETYKTLSANAAIITVIAGLLLMVYVIRKTKGKGLGIPAAQKHLAKKGQKAADQKSLEEKVNLGWSAVALIGVLTVVLSVASYFFVRLTTLTTPTVTVTGIVILYLYWKGRPYNFDYLGGTFIFYLVISLIFLLVATLNPAIDSIAGIIIRSVLCYYLYVGTTSLEKLKKIRGEDFSWKNGVIFAAGLFALNVILELLWSL